VVQSAAKGQRRSEDAPLAALRSCPHACNRFGVGVTHLDRHVGKVFLSLKGIRDQVVSREAAIARAVAHFDAGALQADLARRVAIPTESQNPQRAADLVRYLVEELRPAFERLGFVCTILHEPTRARALFLFAERIEDPNATTVLGYGHGDVIRGLDAAWDPGLSPWAVTERGDRWYGRGVADNKGQHSINLPSIAAVIETRGRLNFNAKWLIEM